jgi:4-carboxymuconolactone decarboxylase
MSEKLFPKGEENIAYSKFFIGKSFLYPMTNNPDCPIANVTFEAGCRNNWHKHPGGQILICISGRGWYQEEGKEAQELHPGDVVDIPINVKHWHGAAKDSEFSHIAIGVRPDKGVVEWLEPVCDAEYNKLK